MILGVAARTTIKFLSIAVVALICLASGTVGVAQVIGTERWCENPVVDAFYYADGHIELDVPARGEEYRRMQFHPPSAVNPEPIPTPEETARGYITFVPAGRAGVVQVYCPATSEIAGTASAFASPGEFEQATFAIRPLRDLGTVTFTLSDFTGPGGAVIPSSVVDMYIVDPTVEQWDIDSRWVDDCEWVGKWLKAGSTATGNERSNVQVLIDVHVPDDAAPGVYSGTVAIQVSGAPTYYFNVQIEVMQIVLERSMPSGLFYYSVALSAPAFREFEMSEMRRTGHTQCVLSPIGGNCGIYVYPDGSLDFTAYDTYVDAYIKAGFEDPPMISLEGQMYNIFAARGVLGQYPFEGLPQNPTFPASSVDAETRAFAGLVLQNIHDHAVSTGWGDWYAYFADEPQSGTQVMEKAKFMCGVAREYVPEMKTAETIYINTWWEELAGMVDLTMKHYIRPVYNATLNEEDHNFCEQMGTSEFYGMGFSGVDDWYWESRMISFTHEKGNMDGMMNWRQNIAMDMAASAYPWSPYMSLVGTGKSGNLSILQTDGSVWRCMPNIGEREGIDDTRYVRTLRKAISDAQANGYTDLANAGQSVLDDALGDVAWFQEIFYMTKPWDAVIADDVRRRLADAIVQLTTGRPHVYVNTGAPGPDHDGQSWEMAYVTVQEGINAAPANSEVWVAAGTYVENITLRSGVVVYGGFAGLETDRDQRNYKLNVTILDGGGAGRVVSATAGVVTAIDGFTIRNGAAYSGGGVYSSQSSVAIRNNTITGNTATTPGGGVYCYYGSSRMSNNIIAGNSAAYGGGIYCYSSSGPVTNNTVVNNTATTAGGGIYFQGSALTASNNIVAFCNSGIYNNVGTPTLRNNCVYGNTSYNYSGISAGTGDISVDPLLVDPSGGNYHIQPTSPCMNAGYNTADAGTLDIDAQPRVYGAHADIGADEVPNTRVTYVNKNAPGPAHDGQSWATGYLTVQEGINAAPSRTEVWVAAGTYAELITLRSRVELYGGFTGTETERSQRDIRTNASIVDGGAAGRVVSAPVGVTDTAVLDGFTIRNGSAASGAGIYCFSSAPTIRNNTITGNAAATGPGGAIWCYAGASPTISNNIIAGNNANYGGGIYCYSSSPTVTSNTLVGNTATFGGGMYLQGSSPRLTNNIIAFGSSGVYRTSGGSPALKKNCVYGNTSYNYSGISAGTGDISVDPLLVDLSGGNYHIRPTSPCMNTGDTTAVQPEWSDIDGQPRVYGSQVDMGADEVHISVSGRVVLQDYSGDVTAIPVSLDLRRHGGVLINTTLSLDANGDFVLNDVEAGTYDLAFKASHWLRKVAANTVVNSNMPGVDISLINGDADGNNLVTPADVGMILQAVDSAPGDTNWDANADLDGDNGVTSTDLSVALLNMDKMGD